MSQNQLAQESSPYLLLHKDNPVHWRAWGPEALAEAESSGKPILLSIGYTACHWCHVMNEESFADAETAALMNELYINIKVDREERPDIDQIYQAATNVMGGAGGWPLTIFLTPGGEPFFSGTYFPPAERQGQPAFKTVLSDIHRLYREQPEQVANATNTVSQNLHQLWGRNLRGPLDVAPIDQAAIRVGQRFDLFFGGMQGTPKFPSFGHVEQLFRAFLRGGVGEFLLLVQATLGNICQGGIYDHLGGGIHRYSTDERWLVPHFEKMLYDNALFVDMLTLSWKLDRNALYRQRVEETIGWVLRDMMVEQGFASSVDADSEGEEGKYYLWSEAEIDAALAGTFSQKFKQVYNVQHDGNNVLGRNILHRLGMQSAFMQNEADEALFTKQRSLLLEARNKRIAPLRDDKVLTDWNGMMIFTLANAGLAFGRPDWINAAIAAFAFVEKVSSDGDRLFHSWSNGKRGKLAFSDDYAHMIRAALMLWQATGERRYFERAQTWTLVLNTFYWDSQNGAYFGTADDADALIIRPRSVFDTAAPCANGIMPTLLGKLFQATWDPAYRDRANAVLDAFSGEIGRAYISMPSFMNSLESVMTGLQIIIVGPKDSNKTRELVSAVNGRCLPYGLVMVVDPSEPFPESHPAFGKTMEGGNPTAYICQQMTCSAPITNPVALSQALQLPRRQPVAQQQQQMGQPVGRA